MKKQLWIPVAVLVIACNNKKDDKTAGTGTGSNEQQTAPATTELPPGTTDYSNTTVAVEGKEFRLSGSILVDKDKKNLKAGAPYRAMITTSSGPDNEGLILRFVFNTQPGAYPLTGMSYGRGTGDKGQQFGGLMGGEEKIYDAMVNLTECKDLGENGAGGHKWSISGHIENLTIPAMGLMLMDKEKNHPKEVKIDKVSFSGLQFDDNAEEMLQKAMEQLKKK